MLFHGMVSRLRGRCFPRFRPARWSVNRPGQPARKASPRTRIGTSEILSVFAAQFASWLMPITLFGTFIVLCLIVYAFTRFLKGS